MRARVGVAVAAVLAAIPVLLVGFWTHRVDAAFHDEIHGLAGWLSARGLDFVDYSTIDFAANIAWFVPFAVLFTVLLGRRRWPVVLVGAAAVSTAIELGQAYLLPERVGSPTDIVANVTGAALGVVLGVVLDRRLRRRSAVTA